MSTTVIGCSRRDGALYIVPMPSFFTPKRYPEATGMTLPRRVNSGGDTNISPTGITIQTLLSMMVTSQLMQGLSLAKLSAPFEHQCLRTTLIVKVHAESN